MALLFRSQSVWALALDICVCNILKAAVLRGRILINELAAFKAEVQFDKKNMACNSNYFSHRCIFNSIFSGEIEGIESDTPE
jgi:hypothetical protein